MKKNIINNSESINSKVIVCGMSDFNLNEMDDMSVCVSQSIRAHRQNSRQGTLGCKGRAELTSRSNKKPWKQKGTGRARAGTPRSPLWRGGGVSHGPNMRVRKLYVSKSMKSNANLFLLSNLIKNEKLVSLDWMPNRSCSSAFKVLKNNKLEDKKIIVLYDVSDYETYFSFSNLKNVALVSFDAVHAYVIAHDCHLVFLEKDRSKFKSLVESWQE